MPTPDQKQKLTEKEAETANKFFEHISEPKTNETDILLKELITEIKGLRSDIKIAELKRDPLYKAIEQEIERDKNNEKS